MAARTLGAGPLAAFWRVALPLARPAIAGGAALALMETLADFGTVAHFSVQTFTTGIYRAWFSFGDRPLAAQLALAPARGAPTHAQQLFLGGTQCLDLGVQELVAQHARHQLRLSRRYRRAQELP